MNDSELIWESYKVNSNYILEESVITTAKDILKDMLSKLSNGGIRKEDLVYYLCLIKIRVSSYYNVLMKKIRYYIATGNNPEYDVIVRTILLVLINITAFGIATGSVYVMNKYKLMEYIIEHKEPLIQFINDIEIAVDKLINSYSTL